MRFLCVAIHARWPSPPNCGHLSAHLIPAFSSACHPADCYETLTPPPGFCRSKPPDPDASAVSAGGGHPSLPGARHRHCSVHCQCQVVGYSPLGRGFLTGTVKLRDNLSADDSRHHMPRFSAENLDKVCNLYRKLIKHSAMISAPSVEITHKLVC